MKVDAHQAITLELALSSAGHPFPRLSKLVTHCADRSFPVRIRTDTTGFSIAILDITLTACGNIHLIEANGSNGGLTSIAAGHDGARASHMALTFDSKEKPAQSVAVLLPFKPGFMHLAEFFARAHLFATLISKTYQARLCLPNEDVGNEQVSIVCGTIPAVADGIERIGHQLLFQGRTVAFACNPNLLPELARRSIIAAHDGFYDIDPSIFHEGRLVPLIHDKGAQQVVSGGTGITPLEYSLAWSFEECLAVIRTFHEKGKVAVGKMNAGSGAAGISFFPPALSTAAIRTSLKGLFRSAEAAHGRNVAKTVFPVRFFEFARSSDFLINGRQHLWDIRMLCLIYPTFVEVTPCLIRICPAPFDGSVYDRDSVVSNLTGRKPSLQWVRSAFDRSAWQVLGIDARVLTSMATACARWCESAWKWECRGPLWGSSMNGTQAVTGKR